MDWTRGVVSVSSSGRGASNQSYQTSFFFCSKKASDWKMSYWPNELYPNVKDCCPCHEIAPQADMRWCKDVAEAGGHVCLFVGLKSRIGLMVDYASPQTFGTFGAKYIYIYLYTQQDRHTCTIIYKDRDKQDCTHGTRTGALTFAKSKQPYCLCLHEQWVITSILLLR